MNPIIRNIFALVTGFVLGSTVNMLIIMVSEKIIPPPEGVDVVDMESLKASMHLFKPINFLFPFLAHSLGTMFGAFLACMIAVNHKMKFAMGIGMLFLFGGIASVYMLPSPMWYNVVDLAGAYFPMAWIGGTIAVKFFPKK